MSEPCVTQPPKISNHQTPIISASLKRSPLVQPPQSIPTHGSLPLLTNIDAVLPPRATKVVNKKLCTSLTNFRFLPIEIARSRSHPQLRTQGIQTAVFYLPEERENPLTTICQHQHQQQRRCSSPSRTMEQCLHQSGKKVVQVLETQPMREDCRRRRKSDREEHLRCPVRAY